MISYNINPIRVKDCVVLSDSNHTIDPNLFLIVIISQSVDIVAKCTKYIYTIAEATRVRLCAQNSNLVKPQMTTNLDG